MNGSGVSKPGFFYGYVIVGCSFLILMVMWGAQYCFGVFFKPMLKEMGLSRAMLSGAYSMNMILQAVACIFIGKLSDKYGPRLVVSICGASLGISYLLMSQVQMVWQIYVIFGILASISVAGSWVPTMSTIARWFVARRGVMCGLAAAGVGLGVMILPPLAGYLIASFGWRIAYMIIGLAVLGVVTINAQLLRRDPAQMGLLAHGGIEEESEGASGYTFREALRTRQFWMLCAVFLVLGLCLQTVLVHIVPHATDVGIAEITAATVLSVIGAISIFGKVGVGLAIDRFGSKPIAILAASLMLLAMIIIQCSDKIAVLYTFAVVFAVAYGGFAAIQSPYVAELFGLKDHGAIFGFCMFILGAAALGPFIAGKIFDAASSYRLAFLMMAVLSFISIVVAVGIKNTERRVPVDKF